MRINVRGEEFSLLHEGALFWHSKKILVIADLHLGKAETFQKQGFWLPSKAHLDDLALITTLIEKTDPLEIIFLGDFVHSRAGLSPVLIQVFGRWVDLCKPKVSVVLGNHDRMIRIWPETWKKAQTILKWEEGEFVFQHEPPKTFESRKFFWVGHIHPKVRLNHGPERWRLSCFVVGDSMGVIPAFCSLAGGFDIKPSKRHQIFAPVPKTDKFVVL